MLSVKTRKVGNSVSLSIPKQLNIEVGKEYVVYQSKNGGLIFSPKLQNPFLSKTPYEDSVEDEWQLQAQEELEKDV